LQTLVDEFNAFGLDALKNEELLDLIVDPEALLENKLKTTKVKLEKDDLSKVFDVRKEMGLNPYTVFQNMKLTVLKPVSTIYYLQDGEVLIDEAVGESFAKQEQLYASDFKIDELAIWEKTITEEEVLNSYKKHKNTEPFELLQNLKKLNVGVWNIWHGGIHWSVEKDGWDSRKRIVEIIKEKNLDVVLLQETYSGGDFIAAELGYYFATTSDWDYKYQGSNISVISRYPIKEIEVNKETEFNNVAVKLAISKTQEVWAMSNWYGMSNFPKVFDFHEDRFKNSDSIPVLFGGDFNAVPHTDGGNSPASIKMIDEGFVDAYRSMYLDVEKHPGFTHMGDVRIDQLYYKGKGLKNTFTEVISTWPSGFPSDHYLIVSKFELNY
jgi:endonuclease/exonuclease/phosphatase family metal-dependent hydrolase